MEALALATIELIGHLIERVKGAATGGESPTALLAEIAAFRARLKAIDAAADAAVEAKFHRGDPTTPGG